MEFSGGLFLHHFRYVILLRALHKKGTLCNEKFIKKLFACYNTNTNMHLLKSEVKSTSCSSSYEKMEGFFEPPKKQLVRRILQRPRLSLRKILSNMEAFKVSLAWRNLQFDLKRLEDLHLEVIVVTRSIFCLQSPIFYSFARLLVK
jgi:hypothetical protein